MANFSTDGQICIEREIAVNPVEYGNFSTRFEIKETCQWITENNFSRVCLQFPDELIPASAHVYEEIKKTIDVDLYILGDTSYASCCVDVVAALHVQANAVIHYGHTCFSKSSIPVYYVLPQSDLNDVATITVMKQNFPSDVNVKLCLFYSQEFDHCKDAITSQWFKNYPQSYVAIVNKKEDDKRFLGRLIQDAKGQLYSAEELQNCICVYLGNRGQSLLNFSVSVAAKELYFLDPETNMVEHIEETSWFKRRRFLIEKCKDANVIGILICKLAGDQTKDIITRMKQLCKSSGKKSYIVSVGKPNIAKLANFPEIEIYVMVACPENDLYSNRDFYQPIVYPYELEVALNSNRDPYFNTHVTDYDELLPGKKHFCDIESAKEETDVSLITGKIRETKVGSSLDNSTALEEKQNWALENIGNKFQERSWKGLEQKLGESEVKPVEQGRKGIALHYSNEPDK